MPNYKLVKIYDENDKEKIRKNLKVDPIDITENIIMLKYSSSILPYFKINNFMLKEDMDHVIIYSETFLKIIKFFLDKKIKINEIKLLEIQEDIEERIEFFLNKIDFSNQTTIDEVLKLLEFYIPKSNIDVQYLKIEINLVKEIIIYNNGVISLDTDDEIEQLKDALCYGL